MARQGFFLDPVGSSWNCTTRKLYDFCEFNLTLLVSRTQKVKQDHKKITVDNDLDNKCINYEYDFCMYTIHTKYKSIYSLHYTYNTYILICKKGRIYSDK